MFVCTSGIDLTVSPSPSRTLRAVQWMSEEEIHSSAVPTGMRKAISIALGQQTAPKTKSLAAGRGKSKGGARDKGSEKPVSGAPQKQRLLTDVFKRKTE